MKKLIVTSITVITMAFASFVGNCNASTTIINNDNYVAIEKAKPHPKVYHDIKAILDEYEEAIKKAKTCEDLENASLSFFIQLISMGENENEDGEELTEAEDKELSEQMDRIEKKVNTLKEKWGCQPEEEEDKDKDEDEDDADEMLELLISETNKSLPVEYDKGMINTKLVREGEYVVYYYTCDENIYDIDLMNKNLPAMKDMVLEELNSDDSNISLFRGICKDAGVGVGYVYVGNRSGKKASCYIPASQLK